MPSKRTCRKQTPETPLTRPTGRPARSSTGPCSIWSSRKAATLPFGQAHRSACACIEALRAHGVDERTPSLSLAVRSSRGVTVPAIDWEPSMPPKRPSSSAVAATTTAVWRRPSPASRMASTHSSATQAPSAPSKAPPSGTVSRCDPAMMHGPSAGPKRPKTLLTASRLDREARVRHLLGEPVAHRHVGIAVADAVEAARRRR